MPRLLLFMGRPAGEKERTQLLNKKGELLRNQYSCLSVNTSKQLFSKQFFLQNSKYVAAASSSIFIGENTNSTLLKLLNVFCVVNKQKSNLRFTGNSVNLLGTQFQVKSSAPAFLNFSNRRTFLSKNTSHV